MANIASRLALAWCLMLGLATGGPVAAQTFKPDPPDPLEWVTVVVSIDIRADTELAEALVAVNDMRSMMQRQPGCMTEALLQNINADNAPRYLHVSRWTSMAQWAAMFRTPGFAGLSAHGGTHYTISAAAFTPAR